MYAYDNVIMRKTTIMKKWKCGFSVKDTTTTSRRMAATSLLKKLNSGNRQISNYVLYYGSRWNHDF